MINPSPNPFQYMSSFSRHLQAGTEEAVLPVSRRVPGASLRAGPLRVPPRGNLRVEKGRGWHQLLVQVPSPVLRDALRDVRPHVLQGRGVQERRDVHHGQGYPVMQVSIEGLRKGYYIPLHMKAFLMKESIGNVPRNVDRWWDDQNNTPELAPNATCIQVLWLLNTTDLACTGPNYTVAIFAAGVLQKRIWQLPTNQL